MKNSIDKFYDDIISPFVRELESDRSNLRYAYGAAWALDSFASHIFYHFKQARELTEKDDIAFKNKVLRPKSLDFGVIMEISAATKHAVRRDPDKTSVYGSSDLSSVNLEGWSAYFAGPDADEWGEQVIVNNDSHLFKPILPIVLRAEKFLIDEKKALQIGY